MDISPAIGNSICDRYNSDNVVCPPKLKHGLFTTATVDNMDHNPSSAAAQGLYMELNSYFTVSAFNQVKAWNRKIKYINKQYPEKKRNHKAFARVIQCCCSSCSL